MKRLQRLNIDTFLLLIAGGNIPAAICSASASNILGMFITSALVGRYARAAKDKERT